MDSIKKFIPPRTDAERALCEGFEAVFGIKCGIDDDFFELGGSAETMQALIENTRGIGLKREMIEQGHSPRWIAVISGADGGIYVPHEDVPAVCPLSDVQQGIYLECVSDPGKRMYNVAFEVRLPEGIDAGRLKEAVEKVAHAHPVFRMAVRTPGGVPSMVLTDRKICVSETTVSELADRVRTFIQPFDLENGPLCRFELCRHRDGLTLLCDVHHIIFDGTSLGLFLQQIADAYDERPIPEETLSIWDVARSQEELRKTSRYRKAQEFFREHFSGLDIDSRPAPDVVTPSVQSVEGCMEVCTEDVIPTRELEKFVRDHGITEHTLFSGAFSYALAAFSGTGGSVFCTANSGRHDPRLRNSVGMFVRTLPVCAAFDRDQSVEEYLAQRQKILFETLKNADISFGELARDYGLSTAVSFIYHGRMFSGASCSAGTLTMDFFPLPDIAFAMDVNIIRTDTGCRILAHYDTAQYTPEMVGDFLEMYRTVLRSMLRVNRLGEISFVSERALGELDRLNRTEREYDRKKTIVQRFREQAKRTPENTCVVFQDRRYTYRQVDELTDNLAGLLVKNGVCREKIVGILIPRCEYMLLGALGVLKAGGAYLPLDPSYPDERLNLMMEDSGAMLLISTPDLERRISDRFDVLRVMTDDIPLLKPNDVPLPETDPNDLFVMLYTSGSTGTPKGVMVEHGNVLSTVEWEKGYYDIDESARVTAYASFGFDAHLYDMYPAVTSGAQLHILSEEIRLDFLELKEYFNRNGITHTVMTTQVGRQFALMGGFTTLKHLSVGGEKLTPLDPPEGFSFHNVYGPTEGSVITSAFRLDRKYTDVPIGRAVDNLKTYVVDSIGRLLPPGAVGELWISGPHVTRGYRNRAEKTKEAYGENPFSAEAVYERVYRTGDIVRLGSDGNLQFVGRRDGQVKVRGFRIELTEIEEAIRRFDGIRDATVAAFDNPSGGKYVAAYVVSDQKVDIEALHAFIAAEKPPYMVPSVTLQIDRIPLNQNQKVNRRALPVPERKAAEKRKPETDVQKKIFEIVSEVVGHDEFGIDTDLYEAGLTSIGAVRLNVALAEGFDVAMKIADVKANSTVQKLEAFLLSARPHQTAALREDYPITDNQMGVFIESMNAPDTTVYNVPMLIRMSEKLEIPRFVRAVRAAADAHPYVKATLFTDAEGNVRARRRDDMDVEVEVSHADHLPEMNSLIRPFALLNHPLYRMRVYETGEGRFFFMDIHHILCDGTSNMILLRDISRAYAGEKLKKEAFTGFEAGLEDGKNRSGEAHDRAGAYWKERLSRCETDCLPRADAAGGEGVCRVQAKDGGKADAISAYCEHNGFTLNSFFNAVFAFVLSRFANKESLTYCTVFSGRNDSRLTESVTLLARTVPVAVEIPEGSVRSFIGDMQAQLNESMAQDACSFAELASAYGVKPDLFLVYQGDSFEFDRLCGEEAELLPVALDAAKAPITLTIYRKGASFEYTAECKKERYSQAFAASLVDSVIAAAGEFIGRESLLSVSMMSPNAEAIYEKLNASDMPIQNLPVHALFEEMAKAFPNKAAVSAAGRKLTFDELNRSANRVACALISRGVKPDTIVGFVLDRSAEALIAEIGILKSGGAFLPMIPSYPDERLEYCLTNAESPFVITTGAIKAQKAELFRADKPFRTLTIEELLREENEECPRIPTDMENLAYCIYTSGSTGTPKGVMIRHGNFTNLAQTAGANLRYYAEAGHDGSSLAISSLSFDMSLYEIYPALLNGKTVAMATEEEIHNPLKLKEIMLREKAQMITATPSFLQNMLSTPGIASAVEQLVTIVCGAEAFPAALYDSLRAMSPGLQIVNGYGPTETSVCCSNKELDSGAGITIGRPTGNVRMFVTDKNGCVLPPYAVGELIICGAGVGRGYVKLPDRTAQPFFTFRGMPAYHSGDLVRLTGNAEIEFCGRIDNQVKLRGFRVELDEIEKVMGAYEGVRQTKVLVRSNGTEDYLAGFFTADRPVSLENLTAFLKSRLTYYMVPAALMQLDRMPLTPNGKIDKKAFPEAQRFSARRPGRRAPKKSAEQRMCEIFAGALGMEEVCADDNFFELGGTSLTASKVTMVLMSEGIEIKYGDIFDHPTPEALADFLETRNRKESSSVPNQEKGQSEYPALRHNRVRYAHEAVRKPLGDVLLTGATGFLGVHVLKELLESEEGHIFCLVRKGDHESCEIRLKTMLIYYFGRGFEEELRKRITVFDADITDAALETTLKDAKFDTVINCAACVKHFADDDILERINVRGVENLIALCEKRDARLIQISTVSIPGIHTPESYEKQVRMHEDELFVIDDMNNKYAISKYHAEIRVLQAIDRGLRAKIIRVGNLMGRHSDGEFQANMETNMFLSGIRGFTQMGMYPISHMADPMRFSPVDCTARAVVLLSGTNDEFTAFHADNRYGFDEMKIIDACNRNGLTIVPTQDETYYEEFRRRLGDDRMNAALNGLAAYDIRDAHAVETDNLFTTHVLYRIGFSWPLVDDAYLDRAINSVMTLDYFNMAEEDY